MLSQYTITIYQKELICYLRMNVFIDIHSFPISLHKQSLDNTIWPYYTGSSPITVIFLCCRHLDHENIAKFFGAMKVNVSCQSSEHKFLFVRQLCTENLRSVIFKDSSKAPAKASTGEVIDVFLKWAKEIADGLMYIHERGLIHRHLKMENILVRINDGLLVLWIYFSVTQPCPFNDCNVL